MNFFLQFIKERKLVNGWLAADPQTLPELFTLYADKLYLYALSLLGSQTEAEEVVQNLFLKLVKNPRLLKEARSLKAYLLGALRNEAFTWREKREKNAAFELKENIFTEPLQNYEENLTLQKAVLELPHEQKEVLVLKIYQQLSFKEIAQVLGISINTCASRYRYALSRLRQELEV